MGRNGIIQRLHRSHRQQQAKQLVHYWRRQQCIEELAVGAIGDDADQLGIVGHGLLGIAEHRVENQARNRDRHARHPRIQQGNRAVLYFAGLKAVGESVEKLLQ